MEKELEKMNIFFCILFKRVIVVAVVVVVVVMVVELAIYQMNARGFANERKKKISPRKKAHKRQMENGHIMILHLAFELS